MSFRQQQRVPRMPLYKRRCDTQVLSLKMRRENEMQVLCTCTSMAMARTAYSSKSIKSQEKSLTIYHSILQPLVNSSLVDMNLPPKSLTAFCYFYFFYPFALFPFHFQTIILSIVTSKKHHFKLLVMPYNGVNGQDERRTFSVFKCKMRQKVFFLNNENILYILHFYSLSVTNDEIRSKRSLAKSL